MFLPVTGKFIAVVKGLHVIVRNFSYEWFCFFKYLLDILTDPIQAMELVYLQADNFSLAGLFLNAASRKVFAKQWNTQKWALSKNMQLARNTIVENTNCSLVVYSLQKVS